MNATAIVLGLAALGGATLAAIRLSGTPRPPTWMALGHGGIAATGLAMLIYSVATLTTPMLVQVALAVLILAALGGATLFLGFHIRELALPIPLVLVHGLMALTGYGLLLAGMFG